MSRRKFFLKMITSSLMRRRSRMLVALLAIAVGATILSGLVTIYRDVPRQMGAEFRNYGANMIFVALSADADFTLEEAVKAAGKIEKSELVGFTPYRYTTVLVHEQPVVAAGTDFENAKLTSPYWYIDGEWPKTAGEALIGQDRAELLGLSAGDSVDVIYKSENDQADEAGVVNSAEKTFTISGILETGGSEEEYLYMSIEDMTALTGKEGRLDVAELSVSASREKLGKYIEEVSGSSEAVTARLVKRVTESESTVLSKLQALVLLVTIVVLLLTMICVATTMTAVVTERRQEIGLRKALGASDGGIIAEFMGEGLLLGGIGGLIGAGLGFAFAQLVSVNVFSGSISFQFWLIPVTMLVSVAVTGLSCLIPVRSATDIDPALVLKGE